MDRTKVLIVLPSLVGGGAERMAVLLLEHFDRERFQPLLALLLDDRRDYAIPEDVPLFCLRGRRQRHFPQLVWRLAKAFNREKPDVVLSIITYANLIAALARKLAHNKPRLLLSEQNYASLNIGQTARSRLLGWAIPQLYPKVMGLSAFPGAWPMTWWLTLRFPVRK